MTVRPFQNFGLKAVSVFVAVLLWFVVVAPVERLVNAVPVEVRNLSSGKAGLAVPPSVSVRVRGSREALASLTLESMTPFVDASTLDAGIHQLPVHVDPIPGLEVVDVDPDVLRVVVEADEHE